METIIVPTEQQVTVTTYTWACPKCGLKLRHFSKRTLFSNGERHLQAQHGEEAEKRRKLEYVQKEIGRIRKQLNRRYGC